MPGPKAFGPEHRLPAKADFDRVFAEARFRFRRHPFMLLARPRPTEPSRLGLVVGRKHARRAVRRNLIRRLARESFRVRDFPHPVDVVLLARPGAADVDRPELRAALDHLWDRLERELLRLTPELEA